MVVLSCAEKSCWGLPNDVASTVMGEAVVVVLSCVPSSLRPSTSWQILIAVTEDNTMIAVTAQ